MRWVPASLALAIALGCGGADGRGRAAHAGEREARAVDAPGRSETSAGRGTHASSRGEEAESEQRAGGEATTADGASAQGSVGGERSTGGLIGVTDFGARGGVQAASSRRGPEALPGPARGADGPMQDRIDAELRGWVVRLIGGERGLAQSGERRRAISEAARSLRRRSHGSAGAIGGLGGIGVGAGDNAAAVSGPDLSLPDGCEPAFVEGGGYERLALPPPTDDMTDAEAARLERAIDLLSEGVEVEAHCTYAIEHSEEGEDERIVVRRVPEPRPVWVINVARRDGAFELQAWARLDGEDSGAYPTP